MDGQIDLFGGEEITRETRLDLFRKECEEMIVRDGTGFLNGKHRIIDYYNDGLLTAEVLKIEYGTGGSSVLFSDGRRGREDHGAGGIRYLDGCGLDSCFTWKEVLDIIKKAIYEGRYTQERLKKYEG